MIYKFITKELAVWNMSIFIIGAILGTTLGLNEQFLNLIRSGISFCGDKS